VAVRNQIATQCKADGDRETAKSIAALRRGSWTDWALNAVADDQPEIVQRYVDAAAEVRSLQAGGTGDLRQALRDLRQFTNDLTAAASKQLQTRHHSPDLLELAERLAVIGASDAASRRLVSATLAADVEAESDATDDEPFVASPRSRSPRPAKAGKPSSATKRKVDPPASPPADDLRPKRLDRAVAEAQASVEQAERDLAEAETDLTEAVSGVEAATAAVEQANAELNTARRAQIDAKRRQQAAQREAVVARRALDRAEAAREKG
jgi:hypothetical protein